jgi:hypothetical protein
VCGQFGLTPLTGAQRRERLAGVNLISVKFQNHLGRAPCGEPSFT